MPLETASFVSDLVSSNPPASDGLNQADDHMRLIKAALKATLAHTGQLTNTDNQLIPADGSATKPAYSFASEPTLGISRVSAGVMAVTGGKLLKGVIPVGSVYMFPVEPPLLGKATADKGKDYLELNGATYNVADYPDLAAFLSATGSTFTVPNMADTGRFPRARTTTVAAGTAQANTTGPHTHPDVTAQTTVESAGHTHAFSGTTGTMNSNASHAHTFTGYDGGSGNAGGASGGFLGGQHTTDPTNTDHTHSFSGNTGQEQQNHTHNVTVSTPANTGTTETRPESLALVFCIKT